MKCLKYFSYNRIRKGDGEINFDEFARVMGERFYRQFTAREIRNAFRYFDRNGDGFINAEVYKYHTVRYFYQ